MNPYDFVQLPAKVERQNVMAHHKFKGLAGKIGCRLTVVTPIFIPQTQVTTGTQRFLTAHYQGKDLPIIPGSSLKGVIRCVAEAVSLSCIGLSGELFERGSVSPKYRKSIDPTFATCNQFSKLCPACRLFGMVSNQSNFLGKVSLSDALIEDGKFQYSKPLILKPLMEPKPRHTAFYQPGGKVAGRKFYFHHGGALKTTIQATSFTKTVVALEGVDEKEQPRTVFDFDVTYMNLSKEEYALLLFALFLTDKMRHKIGGGKPNGLGTVYIEAIELHQIDTDRRYRSLGTHLNAESGARVLTGGELQQHLKTTTAPIISADSASLQDLQYIWQFPAARDANDNPVDYKYPEQSWFDTNSMVPIPDTP
jgi:CRISPR/Cas system CSM-associated protein Csm3 (group 7 of RAMP superfamily)